MSKKDQKDNDDVFKEQRRIKDSPDNQKNIQSRQKQQQKWGGMGMESKTSLETYRAGKFVIRKENLNNTSFAFLGTGQVA